MTTFRTKPAKPSVSQDQIYGGVPVAQRKTNTPGWRELFGPTQILKMAYSAAAP